MGILKLEEYWQEAWINYCGEPNLKGKFNDLEYDENQLRYIVIGEFPTTDELDSGVGYMHNDNGSKIRDFVKGVLNVQDFDKDCYAGYKTYLSVANGKEMKILSKEVDFKVPQYETYELVLEIALKYSIPIIVFNSESIKPGELFEVFFRKLWAGAIYRGAEVLCLPNFNDDGAIVEYTEYAEKVGFSNRASLFDYARTYTQSLLEEYSNISVDFYYSPKVVQIGEEAFEEPKALVFVVSSDNRICTYYRKSSCDYSWGESIDYSNWDFKTYLEPPSTPLEKITYQEANRIDQLEQDRKSLDKRLGHLFMTDLEYTSEILKANNKFKERIKQFKKCS